jgi:hypothetical protein
MFNFQHDCVLMCGSFSVDPGVGIAANTRDGNGWTVAYTAAGRFTITTDDGYRHVVACGAQFAAATPTDRFIAPDLPAGGAGAAITWELDLWDVSGAAVTDPAVIADEIHFWMILSNSQLDRAAW